METLTYHHSRKDLLPIIGLSLIMNSLSIYLIYLGLFTDFRLPITGQTTSLVSVLTGGIGTLFFGYALFYLGYRAIFPKNALIINDKGIIDNTHVLGFKEIILFKNMKRAKLEIIHATPYVGISLCNEIEYLEKMPAIKRKINEINQKNFGASIISISIPHESREELNQIIAIINDRIEITKVRNAMNW